MILINYKIKMSLKLYFVNMINLLFIRDKDENKLKYWFKRKISIIKGKIIK